MKLRRLYKPIVLSLLALSAVLALAANSLAAPIRIMPVGDSITAGTTDANWTYPFSFSYRGALYTQLTGAGYDFQFVGESPEPWNGIPYGVPPVIVGPDLRSVAQDGHRGYGGSTITNITYGTGYDPGIVAAMNVDNPDLVLLMIGINDLYYYGNGSNPTVVNSALKNLTDMILATKPNVYMIVAQINTYKDGTLNNSTVAYNNYIRNTLVPGYITEGYNVSTVDQYANFLNPNGTFNQSLYSNIIHPNAAGYELMADTWFAGIEALPPIVPVIPPPGPVVSGTYTEVLTAPTLPANNLIVQGSDSFSSSYCGGSTPTTWGAQLPDSMNNGVMTAGNAPASTILAWDNVTSDFGWAVYQLDTSANTLGYDVSDILSYAAWSGARVNQAVEIKYALVGDTITEDEELGRTLGSFYYAPSGNTTPDAYTTMSIANEDGSIMLTGVSAIEVKYIDNMFNGNNGNVGEPGNFTAYKQFAVIGSATVPVPPGDANRDGVVDADDAAILAAYWLTASDATWLKGDFNNDGAVNDIDAAILAANWQSGVNASVPEPSTLAGLLGLCLAGLLAFVRRKPF